MSTLPKPNPILAYAVPAGIFLLCWLLTFTAKCTAQPTLMSTAIMIDLMITAPLVYYLAIRKTRVPGFTTLRVAVVGLLVAGWILGAQPNPVLGSIKTWVSPVLEIVTIGYIARRFILANRRAKLAGSATVDFLIHARQILAEVLGSQKLGRIIASEFGVMYYVFRFGKRESRNDTFTTYKNSGILLILYTFVAIFVIETAGMHLLVHLWSATAAWILTALSVYSCLQLMAHIRAIKARPVTLSACGVELYNGLAGDAIVPYSNIEKVEVSDTIPAYGNVVKLTLLNTLEKHNCIIYLKHPQTVTKVLGIQRTADTILCTIDQPSEFAAKVQAHLAEEAEKRTSY